MKDHPAMGLLDVQHGLGFKGWNKRFESKVTLKRNGPTNCDSQALRRQANWFHRAESRGISEQAIIDAGIRAWTETGR